MRSLRSNRSSFSRKLSQSRQSWASPRSAVELLESRTLLTSVVVNSPIDAIFPAGTGLTSLRMAINTANASTSATTITFDATAFATAQTIGLGGTVLKFTNTAQPTTIIGTAVGVTVSGGDKSSIFQIDTGVSASLLNVSITKGNGSGIWNNGGTFKLANGSISDCNAQATAGQLSTVSCAGGFYNSGTATLTNVALSGNTATANGAYNYGAAQGGGALYNDGTVILTNVTVSGNAGLAHVPSAYHAYATASGGVYNVGTATLTNVTVAGNTGTGSYDPGALQSSASGYGGLYNSGAATAFSAMNSVIAGNTGTQGADAIGAFNSLGYNLVGITDGGTGFGGADRTGTAAAPLNAKLGALANNGGLTQTMLPLAGSPAIDHGLNAYIPAGITTDQRGLARIANGTVDIGAVEVQSGVVLPTVSIVATDATATEPVSSSTAATDTGLYTITRTGATTAALVVNLAITGTATNGTDYVSIPTNATIPAGAASATIKLTPKYDGVAESTETAIVTLGTSSNYTIDTAKKAGTVNIINTNPVTTAPEADVLFGTVAIADGDTTPSTTDGTDFGSAAQNAAGPSKTFTVKNTGTAALTTSALTVPAGFAITEGLSASIPAGGSDSFTVQLLTATAGTFQGNISFANNDANENPYNFAVKGAVSASTTLLAPSNLVATAAGTSQINLAWNDNSNNESGFKVEMAPAAGGPWTEIYRGTSPNQTGYQAMGLNADTPYYFQVRAFINGVANSDPSNVANARTQSGTQLNAPTNLQAAAAGTSQINLTWTDTSTGESGFKVERAMAAGGPWTEIYRGTSANQTAYQAMGLSPNTTYYFQVRAFINGVANSGASNVAFAKTQAGTNTGSIAGRIWHDLDGDGVQDAGEPAMVGQTVWLDDGDWNQEAGEPVAVTNLLGDYQFTSLPAGTYFVRQALPSGWVRTTGWLNTVNLGGGQNATGQNFGLARPVAVSGNVFNDANRDGFKDAGEGGLGGWRVFIDADNDGAWDADEASVLTDSAGAYALNGIKPGTFSVRAIKPAGWSWAMPTTGGWAVSLLSGRGESGVSFAAFL